MAHKSRARRAARPKPRRTAKSAFRRLTGRNPGQVGAIAVTPQKLSPLDIGGVPHYWHPDRAGVEQAPAAFARQLAAVHRDLRIVRPPAGAPLPKQFQCWTLWVRQERITQRLCPGWQLLLPWSYYGTPLPLDERLFAAIAHFDRRHLGENAVQYFDRIIRERDRGRERAAESNRKDTVAEAREYFDFTKIKNIGRGNKFALHHDGSVLESRGERNWRKENESRLLPKKVRDEQQKRRES